MKYSAENAVSSFFYYMWNTWSEEECKAVYGDMHRHFWEKWCQMTDKGVFGAAERFYAELTDRYREKLAERAVSLYDGKSSRKQPEESQILVCASCGSMEIEIQAWIDANTNEFHSDVDEDSDSRWCGECESHTDFCHKDEFKKVMDGWWSSLASKQKDMIFNLAETGYSPDNKPQESEYGTADGWWNGLDYDRKRKIYNEYNPDNEE